MIGDHHDNGEDAQSVQGEQAVACVSACRHVLHLFDILMVAPTFSPNVSDALYIVPAP